MANKLILPFSGLLIISAFCNAIPSSRILGGENASPGNHPWVASIRVDGAHACMGSIISERFIITAGRCVSSIESVRITARIGSINQFAGGELVKIKSIFINPSYGNFLHDIALLKVDQNLLLYGKINKIPLATEDDVLEEDTVVSVNGWGWQENGSSPYKLQHASMSVLSSPECELQVGYGYDSVICLARPENTGICQGDEGAGIVSGMKLVGVASFSFGGCGSKYPDVASKISYYSSWINGIIAEKI